MKDRTIERQGGERPLLITFGIVAKCGLILTALTVVTWPVVGQVMDAARAGDMVKIKRLNVAMQLYIADRSDWMPIFTENISGGVCLPNAPAICNQRQMWQFAVYPYHNDWSIMSAPKDGATLDPRTEAYNVSYGYNYSQLSILCVAGSTNDRRGCTFDNFGQSQWFISTAASHIDKPERTIMLVDGGGKDLNTPQVMGSMVNPPDAFTNSYFAYGPAETGWGAGCKNYFTTVANGGLGKTGRWGNTDGFAARYAGGANTILADGHADWLTPAQAAEGTNWTPTIDCRTVQITDPETYRWNPYFLGDMLP